MSFQARAQGDAQAEVVMRNPATNYSKVSTHQTLTLGPIWQRHEVTIEATQTVPSAARLDLVVASAADVWVDEVSLQAQSDGGLDTAGGSHVLVNSGETTKGVPCPMTSPAACQALVDTSTMKQAIFPITLGPRQGRVLTSDLLPR